MMRPLVMAALLGVTNGQSEPYNCRTRERWSEEKTAWCCANKNLGCTPEPPRFCCQAVTAQCEACKAGQTVEEYCATNLRPAMGCPEPYNCRTRERWSEEKTAWCCENKNLGCTPEPPRFCCQAVTAQCEACKAGQTVEEYCAANPLPATGCPEPHNCLTREQWTDEKRAWCCANKNLGCTPAPTLPVACCKALTPSCLACAAGQSVEDWCRVCRARPNSARPQPCKGRGGRSFRQQCRQGVSSAAARADDDDGAQTSGAFAGMVGAIAAVVSAAVAACVVVARRRRSDAAQCDTVDAAEEQLKDTADI